MLTALCFSMLLSRFGVESSGLFVRVAFSPQFQSVPSFDLPKGRSSRPHAIGHRSRPGGKPWAGLVLFDSLARGPLPSIDIPLTFFLPQGGSTVRRRCFFSLGRSSVRRSFLFFFTPQKPSDLAIGAFPPAPRRVKGTLEGAGAFPPVLFPAVRW